MVIKFWNINWRYLIFLIVVPYPLRHLVLCGQWSQCELFFITQIMLSETVFIKQLSGQWFGSYFSLFVPLWCFHTAQKSVTDHLTLTLSRYTKYGLHLLRLLRFAVLPFFSLPGVTFHSSCGSIASQWSTRCSGLAPNTCRSIVWNRLLQTARGYKPLILITSTS